MTGARRVRVRRVPARYKVLAAVAAMTVASIAASYVLSACERDAVEGIATAMIALLGADVAAILGANTVDHWSANKYDVELVEEGDEGA